MPEHYKNLFKDLYTFFQRNINDSDWLKAANEMSMVIKEYDTEFCSDMCIAIYKEFERKGKNNDR